MFGHGFSSGGNLSIVSMKGATGPTLGAAGAVGAVKTAYTASTLCAVCSSPSINLTQVDDRDLDSLLRQDSIGTDSASCDRGLCCSSFRFGGTNVALLVVPFYGQ